MSPAEITSQLAFSYAQEIISHPAINPMTVDLADVADRSLSLAGHVADRIQALHENEQRKKQPQLHPVQ